MSDIESAEAATDETTETPKPTVLKPLGTLPLLGNAGGTCGTDACSL